MTGTMRIDVCDAPHHLLVTTEPGTAGEGRIEACAEGAGTRLVVEERGLPVHRLHFHGAGWQVHLEDLGRSLRTGGPAHAGGWSEQAPAPAWHERWTALTLDYRDAAAR